jgi:hypothetical protein
MVLTTSLMRRTRSSLNANMLVLTTEIFFARIMFIGVNAMVMITPAINAKLTSTYSKYKVKATWSGRAQASKKPPKQLGIDCNVIDDIPLRRTTADYLMSSCAKHVSVYAVRQQSSIVQTQLLKLQVIMDSQKCGHDGADQKKGNDNNAEADEVVHQNTQKIQW